MPVFPSYFHPADVIVEITYHYSGREKKIVSSDGNDEGSMQDMLQLVGCLIRLNERPQTEARDASCTFKSKLQAVFIVILSA